jgi:hypothetical protein
MWVKNSSVLRKTSIRTWAIDSLICQQKRVAILLVRPRNIQYPHLPDDPKALNALTKLNPYLFCTFYTI